MVFILFYFLPYWPVFYGKKFNVLDFLNINA